MSNSLDVIILDVRGEVCPAPLVKAMEAMRRAGKRQNIQVVTDFLPAVLAVTNAALKEDWDINIKRISSNEWTVDLTHIGDAVLSA